MEWHLARFMAAMDSQEWHLMWAGDQHELLIEAEQVLDFIKEQMRKMSPEALVEWLWD